MFDLTSAENIVAQLTPQQKKRLGVIHRRVRLELAKEYGDKLAPVIVESLLRSATVDSDVVAAIEGLKGCLPSSDTAWRSFAKRLVEGDDLALRNLSFREAARKAEIRDVELAKISPARRMQLARTGELDALLQQIVSEQLEAQP